MSRKVLIVDDSIINRLLLKNTLCKDYDILEASNGKEALTVMNRYYKMLSAVLLDIVMPEMDGYEVMQAARANPLLAQIPIIVVTGSEDEESRVKALSFGANDFILKPFNPDIVKHCLKNNIALRETASILNAIQKDKLTGLYNREAFFEKVSGMIQDQEPGYYILSCFDIDNFKLINDQYGAVEGDRILREIGRVVNEDMNEIGGVGGRISADNFAVLLPTARKDMSITRIIQQNRMAFSDKQALVFSVGRYVILDRSLPASALYDRAYIAKQSVKGRYDEHIAYFNDTMLDKLVRDQQIIADMDEAIAEHQFEVWFQPQRNHATGALIGAEALVRWRHKEKGLIPPSDFIPVFEQNGFIYELDKYVWEETCRYLSKWMTQGRNPLPVSVNLSRYDIFRPDLIDVLTGLIEQYAIPVELLRLEITESAFAKSAQVIVQIVKQLIDKGFTVEIDDFGSGYSSLNTLKSVPAQIVKLDMRFLEDDDGSGRGGNILESIVRMTKWLGMSVIAEGVEEKEQADYLASIGCSYIQGYYYARPMPASDYEAYCMGVGKEERLLCMEMVANLDNDSFWNPKSMDTLIFNSYVGAACIFEYHNRNIELLRVNTKFTGILGVDTMSVEDTLKLDWLACLTPESLARVREILQKSSETGEEYTAEYVFMNISGEGIKTNLRSTMRVIAVAGDRMLVYCTSENITAQRLAEENAHAAAEQLRLVLANIDSAVLATVFEENGPRVVFANDQYYSQLGYTRALFEKENPNPFSFIHEEDRAQAISISTWANERMEPYSITYRLIRRDGTVFWRQSRVSFIHIPDEKLPVQLSVSSDVTALKEAEQEIKETSARLQLFNDSIPGGIAAFEGTSDALDEIKLTYLNDGFCKLFGYSREEYEGLTLGNLLDFVLSEDRCRMMAQIEELVQSGVQMDYIYRVKTKGEGYKWIDLRAAMGESRENALTVNAVFIDVTEQKNAMEKLRISEEEYRLAMEQSKKTLSRYCIADETLTVTENVNPVYGLDAVVENVPYGEIERGNISPETAETYINFYNGIRNGEKNGSMIYQRKSSSGWRWVEAYFSTIFSDDGKPVSAVISSSDVTERLEKEAVFKKWQQSLDNRDPKSYTLYHCNLNDVSKLSTKEGSLLSFDFCNAGKDFYDRARTYLKQCVYEEDRKKYAVFVNPDTMLASYYRGNRAGSLEYRELLPEGNTRWLRLTIELVEQLNSHDVEVYLLYENIDAAKKEELQTRQRAQTDALTGLLNRKAFVEKFREEIDSQGRGMAALFFIDLDGFKQVNDSFGHAVGDETLIELSQKLRGVFREQDIMCRLGGDEFVICMCDVTQRSAVIDRAALICALLHKSFSIDVQLSASIGIAICPDDGSDFDTLYRKADLALYHVKETGKDGYAFYTEDMRDEMPALEEANALEAEGEQEVYAIPKRRMLIVEDNELNRDFLISLFSDEFIIDTATEGVAALIRLRRYGAGISIVLLDLMMPGMDGFTVLDQMRESPVMQSIPVIVVSGMDEREASLEAIRHGASDFVTKPVDADLLKLRVSSALNRVENERLLAQNRYLAIQNEEARRLAEAKRHSEELSVALHAAERADLAKTHFLSSMSHEIRTPLNAVIGYNTLARSEMSEAHTDEQRRHAEMKVLDCLTKSEVASRHLLSIINDVLDMSAIESGKMKVEKTPFDFRSLITSLTVMFFSQARAKGVNFEVLFDKPTDEWFVGDPMRINQVLTNLLSNAVKFTPEGGSVTLTIAESAADNNVCSFRFIVADTGIGMTQEYVSHIWTPFEQAEASISRRFGGTGLGLSITKNLVDLMGGRIDVESESGIGSRFTVDLTFARAEQPERSANCDFSNVNALVVDDDACTCDYIKLLFDRCGANCRTFTSGARAVEAFALARDEGKPFNVCLVDWRMPEMDGFATITQIRKTAGKDLPIVVVTAYDFAEVSEQAEKLAINKFISKPLFQSSLFDLLANISGNQPSPEVRKNQKYNFEGARVLLVEDNNMNMEVAKRILLSANLAVDSAWNGREAVDIFNASKAGTYSAILMDVHMPEINGYQATRMIRSSHHKDARTIPIIAMTADVFAEDIAEAYSAGMNDHIAKPIDVETLFLKLASYIEGETL